MIELLFIKLSLYSYILFVIEMKKEYLSYYSDDW